MTTATISRARSSSIGSSMPGWPLRNRVRFTARTASAGTSAGATGNGSCASISQCGGTCRSGNLPKCVSLSGDAHALQGAGVAALRALPYCYDACPLVSMHGLRMTCPDLALDSGTLTDAGFQEVE